MTRSPDDPMELIFCGTPQFAVPTLEKLVESFNVRLVVTQPDRPKGRRLDLVASPIKQSALDDLAADLGEKSVIFAASDVQSGFHAGSTLTDDDGPAGNDLTAECLES